MIGRALHELIGLDELTMHDEESFKVRKGRVGGPRLRRSGHPRAGRSLLACHHKRIVYRSIVNRSESYAPNRPGVRASSFWASASRAAARSRQPLGILRTKC